MNVFLTEWLGDLYKVKGLSEQMVGVICIAAAGLCGAIVGLERERREKPAGLRTLILISVGSTIFTMASLLISDETQWSDRSRIAAQVVTGIGFLGAGAIIHERRAVVGLTTAATIWSVAAVGVVVGAGFVAAGIVLALLIFLILTVIRHMEIRFNGPCKFTRVRVHYQADHGKTRACILGVLDEFQMPNANFSFNFSPPPEEGAPDANESVEVSYCLTHRQHRGVLPKLASMSQVVSIEKGDL